MKYSSSGIELLLFVCVFSITFGFKCDLGPSNVIFLLHSTYTISNEYFEEFKMFACSLATSFNMGRGDMAPPPSALPVPPVSQPSQPVPQTPFIPIPVAASSLAPQPPAIAPSSGKKISNSADYYDYEIPSDPPTLKINKTPLRDDEKMRLAIKRSNDFVEHYEYDEDLKKNGSGNGSEKQTRQKRFTGKSVQQCVCNWNNPDPRTFQSPQIRSVHIEREPKPFEIKDMVIERSGSSKILDGKSIGISKMAMLSSIPFGNNQNLLQSLQLTNGVKDGRGMPKDIHKRTSIAALFKNFIQKRDLAYQLGDTNYV
ncbi:hypothetical protein WR25_18284 [Diploscapter pachys]|uniref:Uncharacterized protein n=1 Tax=Diploscapter pachys TaxID=2018661 RepID=A0A2A2LE11_9BILA|nr:hypothetical protein WR25_18284 [Diploscapter pachys]